MNTSKLIALIEQNSMYMALMAENIREGYQVAESREAMQELHAQIVEAKRQLKSAGIIAA